MTNDENLWSDEICAFVDAAFETVSRNPSDHEEAVAYRRAIAAALRQPIRNDALKVARSALQGMVLYSEMNECWQDNNPQYVEAADEAIDVIDAALEKSK